ncbi:MAG: rhodanese-like domain-containing protein [Gammaproteobacteria bacterium]
MSNYDIESAKRHFAARLGFTTGPHELAHMIETSQNVVIVDVRQPSDYRAGHIPGAVNLPNGMWKRAKGLRKDVPNILYCYSQTCHLAAQAAVELLAQGYPVVEMEGGFPAWEANGGSVETGNSRERIAAVS